MIKIKTEKITKIFNRKEVLNSIDFEIINNKILGIIGKNGTGKSTLLKIIGNFMQADRGNIYYKINKLEFNNFISNEFIDIISPEINLYEELNAIQMGKFYLKNNKNKLGDYYNKLKQLGITIDDLKKISDFSTGMKQKIKISLILSNNKKILLLDEPFSNLDNDSIDKVKNQILEIKNEKIIIIASNKIKDLNLCERIINLD